MIDDIIKVDKNSLSKLIDLKKFYVHKYINNIC